MKELDWGVYRRAHAAKGGGEQQKRLRAHPLRVRLGRIYGRGVFAAQGAVRMGSGVVTLAVPERAWPVLAVKLSESRSCGRSRARRTTACSLSGRSAAARAGGARRRAAHRLRTPARSDEVTEVVCTLLQRAACPIVLDADGIFALAQLKDILRRTARPLVMTPHAGEFARLSGKKQMQPEELCAFAQEKTAARCSTRRTAR